MLKRIFDFRFLLSGLLLTAFLFFISSGIVVADDRSFVIIKDLRESWYVYDKGMKSYVPFVDEENHNSPYIGFFAPERAYKGKAIFLSVPKNTSLLLDNKLVKHYHKASEETILLDSLYSSTSSLNPFFTLYNPSLNVALVKTLIISEDPKFSVLKGDAGQSYFELIQRNINGLKDFYLSGILILLVFFGVLFHSFKKFFRDYFNVGRTLTLRVRDEGIYKMNILSSVNILFLVFLSLTISFLLLSLFSLGEWRHFGFLNWSTMVNSFQSWILLAGLALSFFLLKYLFIYIISSIFLISDFKRIHFYDSTRITIFFFNMLLVGFVVYYLNLQYFSGFSFNRWAIYSIVLFLIFHIIFIFMKLMNVYPYRKLHLFSYLCTTEIIPLIIGLKFFVNN